MEKYILSISAAAIICAIVASLSGSNGKPNVVIKLLCGIFLTLTVIRPLAKVSIPDISSYLDDTKWDAALAGERGAAYRDEVLRAGIKANTEAYILDKAVSMAAQIHVEVTLNDEDLPLPCAVRITGSVSPYVKQQLQRMIENDLGLPKEVQEWIG